MNSLMYISDVELDKVIGGLDAAQGLTEIFVGAYGKEPVATVSRSLTEAAEHVNRILSAPVYFQLTGVGGML